MKLYLLKAMRDIKRKKTRSIPIIIIIMVTGIATTMFANITYSFNDYMYAMWEDNHYHHLLITTRPVDPANLSKLVITTMQKTEISPKYEIRSFYEGKLFSTSDSLKENTTVRILAINTSNSLEVDQLIYYQGESLEQSLISHPMLMDKANADKNNWKIGDKFNVIFENQSIEFTIVGLVASPEYIDQPKITSEFIGNWVNPIIWIRLDNIDKEINSKNNQIAFYFDNPADKNKFLDGLLSEDQENNILFIEGRNTYYQVFGLIFLTIWILSSLIFVSTTITLVYMVLSHLIEEERQTLGVLMSLGFNDKEIIYYFFFYSLILCLIGGFLGSLFGVLGGIQIVSNMFSSDFRPIPTVGNLSNSTIIVGICYVLFITIVIACTSIISSRKILTITPLESIRPNLNLQPGNMVLIEKIFNKFNFHLPPLTRFSLRSVFHKKRKAIFGIIGIAIATTVALFGSFMYIGYGENLNYHYTENEKWDVQVFIDPNFNFNTSNISMILNTNGLNDEIKKSEPFICTPIRFKSDMSRIYNLIGIQENSTMRNFNGISNPSSDSLYITVDVAKRINANKNDFVTIISQNNEPENLKISHILKEMSGNGIFTSISTARSIIRNNNGSYINGLYLKTNNPDKVEQALVYNSSIQKIILKKDLIAMAVNNQNQQITAFGLSFLIGLITGLAISVIIISISISERMRDFVNFRAIGISDAEIFRNVFLEIFIISIGGMITGLFGGIWILNQIFDFISTLGVSYDTNYSFTTLMIPILNIFLGITFSTYFSLRSLFKTSIAESTVSRAIG